MTCEHLFTQSKPINEALAGPNGDGNGCISGYNCRHRAIEYEKGSRPPADFTEVEMRKEYAIDKKQRAYENRIRQLKTEEKELRAQGDIQQAKLLRKKWRRLTKDYQIYSIEHDRAYYPYRYVIDRSEETGETSNLTPSRETDVGIKKLGVDVKQYIPISSSLGKATFTLTERFDIKSERVIITYKQYADYIAKGTNSHDDIFEKLKDHIPDIIADPDYIFISDKKEDTVIYVSEEHKVPLIVKLNTVNPDLSNTIITIFGCGKSTLKRLKKKNEILYEKGIDKSPKA